MRTTSVFRRPTLRVTYVTPALGAGGAERWLVTLINHANRVHPLTVIGSGVSLPEGDFGPLANELRRDVSLVAANNDHTRLVRHLKRAARQSDIILAWGASPFDAKTFADLRIPVVLASHSSKSPPEGSRLAHFYAACSRNAAEALDVGPHPVDVIWNGVPVERCLPTRPEAAHYQKQAWGIDPRAKILLFNGRFHPNKNPDIPLRIIQHLPDDWHLVMHGWGDPTYTEQLIAQTPSLPSPFTGTRSRVCFPKPVTHHVGDLYAAADAVIIPSTEECFPLTLIEAWHSQTPAFVNESWPILHELGNINHYYTFNLATPPQDIADFISTRGKQRPADSTPFSATAMVERWEQYLFNCVEEFQVSGFHGSVTFPNSPPPPQIQTPDDLPNDIFTHDLREDPANRVPIQRAGLDREPPNQHSPSPASSRQMESEEPPTQSPTEARPT